MITRNISLFLKPPAHDLEAPILDVSHLTVRYEGRPALQDISFRLTAGERVAVVGPNGAGKSTLFKAIAGVLSMAEGTIRVAGHCPDSHTCIAYVPQRSQVDWAFPVTVSDVVMMGRAGKMGLLRYPAQKDREYVQQCLQLVDLQDLADRQINKLSGGQQQRMFIARALAQEAQLMLMDEPLTGLDVPAQEGIFYILHTLQERQVTTMVAIHDLTLAAEHFDRVMLLNGQLLGFGHPETVLTPEQLQIAYGGHLRLVDTENGHLILSDTCCEGGF
jgi:manganese/iron transport system ATP-binding protein